MGQMVQLVGAMLILSAYIASQQNRMRLDSVQFLGLNMVGAAILTVVAYVNRDYGFLLLEFVWTWVSARGFRKAYKAEQAAKKAAQKSDKTKGRTNRPHQRLRRGNRPNPLRKVE
jgi:hypothetical protein